MLFRAGHQIFHFSEVHPHYELGLVLHELNARLVGGLAIVARYPFQFPQTFHALPCPR
jgi:hypothetical protein